MIMLVSGLVGLLLNLIFWLPAKFNLVVAITISVACLIATWGGGKLAQPKAELIAQPAVQCQPLSQPSPAQLSPPAAGAFCPKCSCQIAPGQQFCGGCGSSLISYCARCGNAITEPSRFCGKCGAKLS